MKLNTLNLHNILTIIQKNTAQISTGFIASEVLYGWIKDVRD